MKKITTLYVNRRGEVVFRHESAVVWSETKCIDFLKCLADQENGKQETTQSTDTLFEPPHLKRYT
jgi:hypothetical protein